MEETLASIISDSFYRLATLPEGPDQQAACQYLCLVNVKTCDTI
jgi:hypothetical protein